MPELLATAAAAVAVFAATNVDDLLLLAAFFAHPGFAPRAVVAGQLLGIGLLTAASALAAWAALAVPPRLVALLGLVPLALGVAAAVPLARNGWRPADADDDDADTRTALAGLPRWARAPVLAVTLVTLANGGDNLGVYIPLFARDPGAVPLHAAAFLLLTLAWCAVARRLVADHPLGRRVRARGHLLLPAALVGVGVWVLLGAFEGAR